MTTTLQSQPTDIDNLEVIDHLVHEIQNNLQVMLSVMELIAKRECRCAFDATENIERLLEEVRKWFSPL